MITELNCDNFYDYIKKGVHLVAFLADWCGFCQQQKPILYEIANNDINIGIVNSDQNPNLLEQWKVRAFPSFILFKDGEAITNFSGLTSKYDLLNKLLNSLK